MYRGERGSRSVGGWIAIALMTLGAVFLVVGIITQERGFATATILFFLGFAVFFYFLFRGIPGRYEHPPSHVENNTDRHDST